MIIEKDQTYYRSAIKRCERNIEFVERSNFCPKEKKDLIEAYNRQIASYKQNLMSFYPEYQQ